MSALAFRPPREKRRASLSVTPLIDVLFLLIIFFTLTSTFKRVGELELRLPDSSTSDPIGRKEEQQMLELIMTEDGGLFLAGEAVALPRLKEKLRQSREDSPDARILIKAEAGVHHGDVVRLLDIVRDAGFPGVGLGTYTAPAGGDRAAG